MRSTDELMIEIFRRKEICLARRQVRRLTAVGAGLAALLLTALFIVPGITGGEEQYTAHVMGATILGPETGGYVIVALLAFVLGIIVTLLIQKRRTVKDAEAETRRKER